MWTLLTWVAVAVWRFEVVITARIVLVIATSTVLESMWSKPFIAFIT